MEENVDQNNSEYGHFSHSVSATNNRLALDDNCSLFFNILLTATINIVIDLLFVKNSDF